jgi:predicted thioesterase
MALRPGLCAALEIEVGEADTALAVGSGDVPVLATPRLVALAEQATVRAVREQLPAGHTSVGTDVVLHHRRPSGPGAAVTITARLRELDGARLTFQVAAYQAGTLVAEGTVRRVIVDRAAFLDRVYRSD